MVQSHDNSLHIDVVHRVAGNDSLVPLQGGQQVKETKWAGMKVRWSSQCQAVHCLCLCSVHLFPPCRRKTMLVEKCRRHSSLSFVAHLSPCLSVEQPRQASLHSLQLLRGLLPRQLPGDVHG